ncbi:MAG: sulfatase-like hydrolase/transferase, partial [Holophagales bacterium]|nr:sulfatase-like hydrolase/transferase [Holophagales bacterium]
MSDQPAGEPEPRGPRPNILFLFADDQRADTIRAWGNELIDTPNLDRLVAEGWSFRRNYVFGSNSGAVCVPSRAMVLTGRSWMRSPNRMEGVPTLPRLLEAEGYRTFITGKWHNGEEALLRVFDRGTAIYLGGVADHTQTEVQD